VAIILIGIDDTDNATSPGTGRLARDLSGECQARRMRPLGVTRHQFLVDPAIPYTSHNSGACIAVNCPNPDSLRFLPDFLASRAAEGSDPGLCIAAWHGHPARETCPTCGNITPQIIAFAQQAARCILTMPSAFAAAKEARIALCGLGGTCQGVIGALASVGMRASGNDGRFLDLPGLRQLQGCIRARDCLRIGVQIRHDSPDRQPRPNDRYETRDWVRPRLIDHRPVWPVQWSEQENAWIPIDRRNK
jgi:hypothetical protein